MVNALERVKVPKKTTSAPYIKKRGRAETNRNNTASEKRPRKEKSKNVIQPVVE
jgi:hypothetical protein